MSFSRGHFKSLLCLISFSLIFCSLVCPRFSETIHAESSGFLKYEVNNVYVGKLKHVIQIVNNSSSPVKGELFVPLVKNETTRLYVILQNTSPSKMNDSSGNIYIHWDDLTIDGWQTFSVELNYYVLSFDIHYLINSSIVENYDTSSEIYKKYTEPEELIECKHFKIDSLAHNLTDDADDWHEKASEIYNFVYRHMHYSIQDKERGALWALEKGVGDCSEYSYLFVALCRAAGIPARIQAGFAFHRASETLEDGHMWAEYYLENYGWIPVDVTWRLFNAIDHRHFSSIQSIPEVIPYANFFFDCKAEEKDLEEEQIVSLTPCSTDVLRDSFVENIVKIVTKMKQAKFAIFLTKLFGASLIFPSEAEEAEQTFLESEIYLQNAIDSWEGYPKLAQSNMAIALEDAENVLRNAWMLTAKTFTIFIGISIVILLIALVFLKRHQVEQEKMSS